MKRNILLLAMLIYCLLATAQSSLPLQDDSQKNELTRLENTLANIRTDLQEKALQYNWKLTEKYIDYCKKLSKITNFNKEPRLVQIATVRKPKELEPLRLAYEKLGEELTQLLKSYPEYVVLDSLYKRAENAEQKKTEKLLWMDSINVYTKKM